MVRVYDYRLYPAQERSLSELLESLRLFYNAALQERRDDFRRAKEAALASGTKPKASVSLATQEKAVKHVKALCPEYDALHTHLYQDALSRLRRATHASSRSAATRPSRSRTRARATARA
ncbi:MAG: helix-turn-helix domain-containing protein [Polyangiaceae bacterium]|nr:helix-turn-helix domain-containing protein [Polyangiaceae bacterium]